MASSIPKMKLYYFPLYRSVRCVWLVKELGIEDKVEYVYIPMTDEPPAPARLEYAKSVHPLNTIPALAIDGQEPILESTAICLYLADAVGKLIPSDPVQRADFYNWALFAGNRMDECMEVLASEWWFKPGQPADIVEKAKSATEACFDLLEKRFATNKYILGDQFSAADCVMGYNILWGNMPEMKKGVLVEERPNVKAYLQRLKERPAYQQAINMK